MVINFLRKIVITPTNNKLHNVTYIISMINNTPTIKTTIDSWSITEYTDLDKINTLKNVAHEFNWHIEYKDTDKNENGLSNLPITKIRGLDTIVDFSDKEQAEKASIRVNKYKEK